MAARKRTESKPNDGAHTRVDPDDTQDIPAVEEKPTAEDESAVEDVRPMRVRGATPIKPVKRSGGYVLTDKGWVLQSEIDPKHLEG